MARTSLSTGRKVTILMCAQLTLVIGNKNYSSWSLRAWLLLKHAGVELRRDRRSRSTRPRPASSSTRYGPSGRVPVLHDGELRVWDSLAICEYVAELTGKGWPQARAPRAPWRAR